ncbi:hypothetical protein AYI70_g3180 [Smittium culicis]|uniref:Uncharacterized protein n=1 Tax=Smittium culicis TaxID=133412 RepID=A0A1R1Y589_9FUNG|nr:hypothetical protein AYI70_g3180 [Smittium culicis]
MSKLEFNKIKKSTENVDLATYYEDISNDGIVNFSSDDETKKVTKKSYIQPKSISIPEKKDFIYDSLNPESNIAKYAVLKKAYDLGQDMEFGIKRVLAKDQQYYSDKTNIDYFKKVINRSINTEYSPSVNADSEYSRLKTSPDSQKYIEKGVIDIPEVEFATKYSNDFCNKSENIDLNFKKYTISILSPPKVKVSSECHQKIIIENQKKSGSDIYQQNLNFKDPRLMQKKNISSNSSETDSSSDNVINKPLIVRQKIFFEL